MSFTAPRLLLGVGLLLLAACKKDTATIPTYKVEIRLQGTDTAGLLPQAVVYRSDPASVPQAYTTIDATDGNPVTWGLGAATFTATDEVVLEVGFRAVTASGTTQARPTSKLVGSVLVNSVVKGTATIDNTASSGSNSYARADVHVLVGR